VAYTGIQTGTRITAKIDEKSSIWTYVKQACIGAAAIDLALACLMTIALLMGWWSVPVVFVLTGLLIAWTVVRLVRPESMGVKVIVGNLAGFGLILGVLLGRRIWHWLLLGSVRDIVAQAGAAIALPWWAWLIEAVLWFVSAWKKRGKLVGGVLAIGTLGYAGYQFEGWVLLSLIWSRLRWALIPFLWPVIGFALFLAIVMFKEMALPNWEWTMRPVSLEEVREIGLVGLWFPHLFGGPPPDPMPDRHVKVEVLENGGKTSKIGLLPDTFAARAFYAAVHRGEPFTSRTARKYGVSLVVFNKRIRDVFFDRGWAEWEDEEHHEQGINVFPNGMQTIEHLALTGTTPSPTG